MQPHYWTWTDLSTVVVWMDVGLGTAAYLMLPVSTLGGWNSMFAIFFVDYYRPFEKVMLKEEAKPYFGPAGLHQNIEEANLI